MDINIKCFATLANAEKCDYRTTTTFDLPAGQTIKNLLARIGVDREAVKIAFVNNRIVGLDTVLEDGDQVALAPAVGGM
jgi:molybdopterin converting factor small subunit